MSAIIYGSAVTYIIEKINISNDNHKIMHIKMQNRQRQKWLLACGVNRAMNLAITPFMRSAFADSFFSVFLFNLLFLRFRLNLNLLTYVANTLTVKRNTQRKKELRAKQFSWNLVLCIVYVSIDLARSY